MKTVWLPAVVAVCISFLASTTPGLAKTNTAKTITISKPWTRATLKGAPVAGGFMTIRNTGKKSDYLVGGTFDAASRVEIHEMAVVNDVMKMRELPDGLEIKPGQTVVLKPGSYHAMFMGLKRQLGVGETVKGTLVFKTAGTIPITYAVNARDGKKTGTGMHGGHGKMKH